MFHQNCIHAWLLKSANLCPLCKAVIHASLPALPRFEAGDASQTIRAAGHDAEGGAALHAARESARASEADRPSAHPLTERTQVEAGPSAWPWRAAVTVDPVNVYLQDNAAFSDDDCALDTKGSEDLLAALVGDSGIDLAVPVPVRAWSRGQLEAVVDNSHAVPHEQCSPACSSD